MGRHVCDLKKTVADKTASNAWLKAGKLFPQTAGFMIASRTGLLVPVIVRNTFCRTRTMLAALAENVERNQKPFNIQLMHVVN